MKKSVLCLLIVLIPFVAWCVGYYFNPYFSPAKRQSGLTVERHDDDTVRIAYIGDSWADWHQGFNCNIDSLVNAATGKPVVVKMSGISGLTSKNIYYSMFRNRSVRNVMEWGPDFCFVAAGINDSDRKLGKGYYKENMRLIIELLLSHRIVPVILEIPSFNIRYSYERRDRLTKFKYLASMVLTGSKMDCIDDYREEYVELVNEHNWQDKVITIWHDDWNPDGYKDSRNLYDEGLMHLNQKGYSVMDACIARKIAEKLLHSVHAVDDVPVVI